MKKQMGDQLSLSLFAIESGQKPLIVFAAKTHREAEAFFADERFRANWRLTTSSGIAVLNERPFCMYGWRIPMSAPVITTEWQNRRGTPNSLLARH
jgi:hypothetical protein